MLHRRTFTFLLAAAVGLAMTACSVDNVTGGGPAGGSSGTGGTSGAGMGGGSSGTGGSAGAGAGSSGSAGAGAGSSGSAGAGRAGSAGSNGTGGGGGATGPGGASGTDGGSGAGSSGGADAGRAGSAGSSGTGGDGGATADACSWRDTAPVTVTTPFAAPDDSLTFTPPTIPCRIVDVTTKGVMTSGTSAANRAAMNQAIAELGDAGGGVIDVPRGTYRIGAVTLMSNIELHLEEGAVLSFSAATSDYEPPVLTRWEGLDCLNWQPAVYALGATNVAITGQGTLHGPGTSFGGGTANWKNNGTAAATAVYNAWMNGNVDALKTSGPPTLANMASLKVPTAHTNNGLRPTFIECNGCTNFMLEGLLVDGGWYWNIHPLYSSNVIVRNLTVSSNNGSSNGDGVNPDSSTNVLIDNVKFNTSDDMIAIKSGTNEPGFYIARPSHNIVAHNLKVQGGHGFSIGSELSGGVDNVYEYNDTQQTWTGVQYLLRVKTPTGRGAVEVANLWFEDVAGTGTSNDIFITTNYASATIPGSRSLGTPTFRNINIKNVRGGGSSSCTTPLASKDGSTLAQNSGC